MNFTCGPILAGAIRKSLKANPWCPVELKCGKGKTMAPCALRKVGIYRIHIGINWLKKHWSVAVMSAALTDGVIEISYAEAYSWIANGEKILNAERKEKGK